MNRDSNIVRIIHTAVSIPLIMVLWSVIYMLGRGAIFLFDKLRGLDSSIIQGAFIELLAPGISSYIAIYLCKNMLQLSEIRVSIFFYLLISLIVIFCFPTFIKTLYFGGVEEMSKTLKFSLPISLIIGSAISFYKMY